MGWRVGGGLRPASPSPDAVQTPCGQTDSVRPEIDSHTRFGFQQRMPADGPIQRVAIVGTGLIGASWAAHFLAHGLDVTATDPAPGAERDLRSYVARVWPVLTHPVRYTYKPGRGNACC